MWIDGEAAWKIMGLSRDRSQPMNIRDIRLRDGQVVISFVHQLPFYNVFSNHETYSEASVLYNIKSRSFNKNGNLLSLLCRNLY